MPSGPGAPPFRSTLRSARAMLALDKTSPTGRPPGRGEGCSARAPGTGCALRPGLGGCTACSSAEAHNVGWLRSSSAQRATSAPPRVVFGPSRLFGALPAGTTASADSCRVHAVVAFHAAGTARCTLAPAPQQASPNKGFDFPSPPAASTWRALGGDGPRRVVPAHPGPPRLTDGSCSSVQGFASTGFLKTPPHDGALACGYGHTTSSPGLSPASHNPCRAYNPKGPGALPGPLAFGSKGCSVAANAAVGHCFFSNTEAPVVPPSEVVKL